MEQILDVLKQAIQEDLIWVALAIICVAMLYTINSILGLAIAMFKAQTDWKRFLLSQAKNIVVLACIFASCYALNVFVLTMNLIDGMSIQTEYVTALEIVAIVITWCIDLAKDIVEKLKGFKELKYVKYEDVHYNEGSGVEE